MEDTTYGESPSTQNAGATIEKWQIIVRPGEQDRIFKQASKCIVSNKTIYRRGPYLVHVILETKDTVKLTKKTTIKGTKGQVKIIQFESAVFSAKICETIEFENEVLTKEGETFKIPINPPSWLVTALLRRGYQPGIREIVSISETPFLREDGSVCSEVGLDPESGVFLYPNMDFPKVPDNPSRDDALTAFDKVMAPFKDFPFASTGSKAAFLADLLTVMARPGIPGPVPGFAYTANKAGTGKSKLVHAVAMIATGRPAPITMYPTGRSRDEEMVKQMTALAIQGRSIVLYDDLNDGSEYGSGPLDSALTGMTISNRILGKSELTAELPLRPTWHCTGNNISAARTAARRWLQVVLLTDLEFPERRPDLPDVIGWLKANRAEMVSALLIMLRAHAVAGYPRGYGDFNLEGTLGSFDDWDKVVRGCIGWLTSWDCIETQQRESEDNQERDRHIILVNGIKELPEGRRIGHTAKEMVDYAQDKTRFPAMATALDLFGFDGKPADVRLLGTVLRGKRDNVVNGSRIVRGEIRSESGYRWRVEDVGVGSVVPEPVLQETPPAVTYQNLHSKESEMAKAPWYPPNGKRMPDSAGYLLNTQRNLLRTFSPGRQAEFERKSVEYMDLGLTGEAAAFRSFGDVTGCNG